MSRVSGRLWSFGSRLTNNFRKLHNQRQGQRGADQSGRAVGGCTERGCTTLPITDVPIQVVHGLQLLECMQHLQHGHFASAVKQWLMKAFLVPGGWMVTVYPRCWSQCPHGCCCSLTRVGCRLPASSRDR